MAGVQHAFASETAASAGIRVSKISLPEDTQCAHRHETALCNCVVRTGGDLLRGVVEVTSPPNRIFTIIVRLEGFCRTWIQKGDPGSPPAAMAQIRFLQIADTLSCAPSSSTSTSGDTRTDHLSFTLKIPRRLISPRSDVDTRFLDLYPSTQLGNSYFPAPYRARYMQPLITYRLSASVPSKEPYEQQPYCERTITVMPTKVSDPPIYIGAYPREFTLAASSKLRKGVCSSAIGTIHVAAGEPMPIDLAVSTPRACTYVPVTLSFQPHTSSTRCIDPGSWKVIAKSRVRRRIFYSTHVLDHEPTLECLEDNKHLAMRSGFSTEETRCYTDLPWGGCSTRLYVAVSMSKSFTPSFLTPLAAVRYSVLLKFSVVGMRSKAATVEVPLQVYRSTLSSNPRELDSGAQVAFSSEALGPTSVQDLSSFWEDPQESADGPTRVEEQLPRYRYRI